MNATGFEKFIHLVRNAYAFGMIPHSTKFASNSIIVRFDFTSALLAYTGIVDIQT